MEHLITRGIISEFFNELMDSVELDVAIVGAGPSGLVAAAELAAAGLKTAIFESALAPGGGMWGGAMLFNKIIVQPEALFVLDEAGISHKPAEGDLYTASSVEATAALVYRAAHAGARIYNGMYVEDAALNAESGVINGVVVNWAPVTRQHMHVDPIVCTARAVVDATGHPSHVVRTVLKKNPQLSDINIHDIPGERSLAAAEGERLTVEHTGQICPGLYVCGMAANGVSGSFRMGPIFGGMLLSGKKIAALIKEDLGRK